uniref:Uncharacterized protein n=1 Tax=Anguilla anguilla TaxID=7936 RepID=A0A0E9T0Q8_ANGAN
MLSFGTDFSCRRPVRLNVWPSSSLVFFSPKRAKVFSR